MMSGMGLQMPFGEMVDRRMGLQMPFGSVDRIRGSLARTCVFKKDRCFPPSKCGRVLQSQWYTTLKTRQFLDLDEDGSPQLNYGQVLKTQPRHSLS